MMNHSQLPSLQAEVNFCYQLVHPNLVKLIGYSLEDECKRLLVYEFAPNLSLDKHLCSSHSGGHRCGLSWDHRIKIALGAAKGLAFLHSDEAKVVYGNFNSSKILIDSSYNAKLHGYGVGKIGSEGYRSRVPFHEIFIDDCVMDDDCHQAPECILACKINPKVDVYSFGLVLFEILSGEEYFYRKMSRGQQERKLLQSVRMGPFGGFTTRKHKVEEVASLIREMLKGVVDASLIREMIKGVVDASIEGQYSEDAALKALCLAIQCLSVDAVSRPNMDQVVQVLEQL